MFALTSKAALVPAKVRVNIAADRKKSARSTSSPSNPRRISRVAVKASSKNNNEDGPSRRDILAAPGLAAFLSAAAAPATTLWLPGAALAKPAGKGGIKPTNVTGIRFSHRGRQARPHRRRGPVLRLQSMGEDDIRIHQRHQERRMPARVQERHARVPPQARWRSSRYVYFYFRIGN